MSLPEGASRDSAASVAPLPWILAVGLLASTSAVAIDSSLPALPGMAAALGVPQKAVQLSVASYLLGFALAQIPLGLLADRFGRLPVAFGGLAVYVAAGLVCALADDLHVALAARVLQGLGGAAGPVIARAIVRDTTSGAQAARLLSLITSLLGAGMVVAPLVGGALAVSPLGWRGTIALPAVLALLTAAMLLAFVGETHPPSATRRPPLAQLGESVRALLGSARSLVGLGLFAAAFAGQMAIITQTAAIVVEVYGLAVGWVGPAFAVAAAAFASGAALARVLVGRLGVLAVLERAVACFALCAVVLLAFLLAGGAPFPALWATAVVYLGAMGVLMPTATAITLEPLGRVAGFTSSVLGTVQVAVAAVASLAVAAWYDGTEIALIALLLASSTATVGGYLLGRPVLGRGLV